MTKDFFIKLYNYNVASSASYKSFSCISAFIFCKINLNCQMLKELQTNLQYWKLLQKISREPCKSICSLFCQFNPSPVVSDSFFVSLFQIGLHAKNCMYFCFKFFFFQVVSTIWLSRISNLKMLALIKQNSPTGLVKRKLKPPLMFTVSKLIV